MKSDNGQARLSLQHTVPGGNMIRRSYLHSSDLSVMAAQRGAAVSKGIAAIVVLVGILAIAVLAARDVRPAPAVRGGTDLAEQATASPISITTATEAAGLNQRTEEQPQFDPREIDDYRSYAWN
jgi:hypothetical protein